MPTMPGYNFYHGPLSFISVTQLIEMSRCPRRFFYHVGARLVPLGGTHAAMTFGEAIHGSIPHAGHENNLKLATEKFLSIWQGATEDAKRNAVTGIGILQDFNNNHAEGRGAYDLLEPPQVLQVSGRVSDYEIPFALQLPNLSIPILGRIDGLCRHKMTGELYVLEYKTYSKGPYNYNLLEALETHIQGWLYVLAARTYGIKVRGVIYETIMVDTKTRKLDLKIVQLSDHNLEEAVNWAVRWGRAVQRCEELQDFPTERTGCNSYSHYATASFSCDFKSLCATHDWTTLKALYNEGKQHLPFEIPENFDFQALSQQATKLSKDRSLEARDDTITALTISGK